GTGQGHRVHEPRARAEDHLRAARVPRLQGRSPTRGPLHHAVPAQAVMEPEEILTAEVADPTRFGSPTALGVKVGNQVFVSGMLAWDTERRIVGVGDVKAQTRKALQNIDATLKAAGGSLRNIVKINFYLTDIRDKTAVWEVRKEMF